jgi:hypothetical protein
VLESPDVLRRLVLVMLFSYKIQLDDNFAALGNPSMGGDRRSAGSHRRQHRFSDLDPRQLPVVD